MFLDTKRLMHSRILTHQIFLYCLQKMSRKRHRNCDHFQETLVELRVCSVLHECYTDVLERIRSKNRELSSISRDYILQNRLQIHFYLFCMRNSHIFIQHIKTYCNRTSLNKPGNVRLGYKKIELSFLSVYLHHF